MDEPGKPKGEEDNEGYVEVKGSLLGNPTVLCGIVKGTALEGYMEGTGLAMRVIELTGKGEGDGTYGADVAYCAENGGAVVY